MKKILFGLIIILILIPVVLYFFKINFPINNFNFKLNNKSTLSKQEITNGFLDSNMLSFPKDMNFVKGISKDTDLGKSAIYYDYNPHGLTGTTWVFTKNVASESEYQSVIAKFNNYYNLLIHKNGWTNEVSLGNHLVQPIAADSPAGHVYGYLKHAESNIQEILLYNQKDSLNYPANVQFRVFLSDIKPLTEVIK